MLSSPLWTACLQTGIYLWVFQRSDRIFLRILNFGRRQPHEEFSSLWDIRNPCIPLLNRIELCLRPIPTSTDNTVCIISRIYDSKAAVGGTDAKSVRAMVDHYSGFGNGHLDT